VAYEIDGERTTRFPVPAKLDRAKPVYETLEGWKTDISDVRRLEDLPASARDYVARVEELIEVPVRWVSVGPQRDAIIRK
jgi:adenylosuccinate synthase